MASFNIVTMLLFTVLVPFGHDEDGSFVLCCVCLCVCTHACTHVNVWRLTVLFYRSSWFAHLSVGLLLPTYTYTHKNGHIDTSEAE